MCRLDEYRVVLLFRILLKQLEMLLLLLLIQQLNQIDNMDELVVKESPPGSLTQSVYLL